MQVEFALENWVQVFYDGNKEYKALQKKNTELDQEIKRTEEIRYSFTARIYKKLPERVTEFVPEGIE